MFIVIVKQPNDALANAKGNESFTLYDFSHNHLSILNKMSTLFRLVFKISIIFSSNIEEQFNNSCRV